MDAEKIREEFGYAGKPKQWKAGFDALLKHLPDYQKEANRDSLAERRVIKRVCSEATKDCKPCICSYPHTKHLDEDDEPCTKWKYCHWKGRKVRCTKAS